MNDQAAKSPDFELYKKQNHTSKSAQHLRESNINYRKLKK